jgi:ketosteroid isomerase-like protein
MIIPIGILTFALLVASQAAGQVPPAGSPLRSLVDTERAFSKMSVAEGTRAAFLAYFAEDGVSFAPEPVNTRDRFSKLLATPPTVVLEWMPVTADIAGAGDLGYTTGPWVRSERAPGGKPLAYGWYFTVWKKQPDGSWKAAADIGTTTPAHTLPGVDEFRPAGAAQMVSGPTSSSRPADSADILAAEKLLSDQTAASELGGYVACAAPEIRLHRDGAEPIVGAASVRAYLGGREARITSTPIKADVSRSGDLGYAYGSYVARLSATGTAPEERGYYLRVWKRQAGGWRLVADITTK